MERVVNMRGFILSQEMLELIKHKISERDTDICLHEHTIIVHKAFPTVIPCRGCKGTGCQPMRPHQTCKMCEGDGELVMHGVKVDDDLFTPLLSRQKDVEEAKEHIAKGAVPEVNLDA